MNPFSLIHPSLVAGLLLLLLSLTSLSAQTHPFIIVKSNEYAAMQALAVGGSSKAPYIRMFTDAKSISATTYDPTASLDSRAGNLIKIMDASALAYILDTNTTNRNTYRNRFYNNLKYWDLAQTGNITKDLNINDWTAGVKTAAAFFSTVVAMDVFYNDANTTAAQITQRDNFSALMEASGTVGPPNTMGPANFFNTQYEPYHLESLMSARAIWALWKNGLTNNTALNDAVAIYKEDWLNHITDDGCYVEYTGYAMARSGDPSRYNKGVFHDVIVYSGIDPNWYANAKMTKFYEWLAGYALMPNRYGWPLGDSSYAPFSNTYASPFDRASKFSTLAGNYGEWQQNGAVPPAKLFSYLVRARTTTTATAQEPVSRIFANGAAYLRQKNGGTNSLASVLTNLKYFSVPNIGHIHKATNSLSIASFGEILLRGPGYNGYGAAATDANNFGFNFAYVNNHAISQNIALFNYNINNGGNYQNPTFAYDHRSKFGGYGVQGLLSDGLDYATGDSGFLNDPNRAIDFGHHIRHVVSIYPQDGVNGYIYTVDELEGNPNTTTGQLAWHPYGSVITFNSDNASADRYEWAIRQKANMTDQLYLSIFMPTVATTRQQYDGLFADDIQGGTSTSFVGRYIFNGYTLDANKKKNVLTMFFPRKSTQAIPVMQRITPSGTGVAQAAAFAFAGGVTDLAMESDGSSERTIASQTYDANGAAARGKAVIYRKINGNLAFYFVGKGRSFKNPATNFTQGFLSDADVDLHMKGNTGSIVSPGTNVTFYAVGNPGARIDGTLVTPISYGAGFVRVALAAGTHTVVLEQLSGANTAPSVAIASVNTALTLPAIAQLAGTISDDGQPLQPGTTSVSWSKQSGPGTVTFGSSAALQTSAAFSTTGTYLLRLTGSDGALSSFAEISVSVGAPVSGNPEQVIYRETFGNNVGSATPIVRFDALGWQYFTAPDDATNVANSTLTSNGGSDYRAGRPANLDNQNAGFSASQSLGYAYSINGRRALAFTTEFPINRSVYQPTKLSWYSHISTTNSGTNNQSPAVRIGGQWYVIALSTGTGGNLTTTGGGANFNTSATQITLDFSNATATVAASPVIVTSGWRTLIAAPGAPFSIGAATTLPPGNIEAFGVYFTTAGDSTARFDSFEVQATIVPVGTTLALSSSANPVFKDTSVTLSALANSVSGPPAGFITFMDGTNNLGTAPLDSLGVASLTTSSLALGSHSITAVWAGNASYLASNSAPLSQVIQLTPFDSWRVAKFSQIQLNDLAISGPNANPDSDAATNFMEYALDLDPLHADGALVSCIIVPVSLPEGGAEDRLSITFFRARAELDYTVEGSSDLVSWLPVAVNSGTVGTQTKVVDTEPISAGRRFLRLRVAAP